MSRGDKIFIGIVIFLGSLFALFATVFGQNDTNTTTTTTECASTSLICNGGYTYDINGCIVGCLNQTITNTTTTTIGTSSVPAYDIFGQILAFFSWIRSLIPF